MKKIWFQLSFETTPVVKYDSMHGRSGLREFTLIIMDKAIIRKQKRIW